MRTYSPKTIFTLILIAAVAAGAGLWLGQKYFQPQALHLDTVLTYPNPKAIAPFQLQAANQQKLSNQNLEGGWTLLFFGFTHCPDICPTTLTVFKQIENLLKDTPAAAQVRYWFVSVDPERDDPDRSKQYAEFFSANIVAATAGHEVLEPFARQLGVVYAKQESESENYNVDHTASILLISPQGRLHGIIRPPHDAKAIAADLSKLSSQ